MNQKNFGLQVSPQQASFLKQKSLALIKKSPSLQYLTNPYRQKSPVQQQHNKHNEGPKYSLAKPLVKQNSYVSASYRLSQSIKQIKDQTFDLQETDKINFILGKMQRLQNKLNTVQESIDQKTQRKHGPYNLLRVKSDAKLSSPFSNKLENSMQSARQSQKFVNELDGIQSRIEILNQRKDYLLQNHKGNLDYHQVTRYSRVLNDNNELQDTPRTTPATTRQIHRKDKENYELITLSTSKLFSPDVSTQGPTITNQLNSLDTQKSSFIQLNDDYGNIIYQGDMKNGRYDGKGRLQNIHHPNQIKGNFLEDLGELCIIQSATFWTFYEGQFQRDKFHGLGNLSVGNLYKLNGQFLDGAANGRITIINKQRNFIALIGIFKNGFIEKVILQKNM